MQMISLFIFSIFFSNTGTSLFNYGFIINYCTYNIVKYNYGKFKIIQAEIKKLNWICV